MSVLRNMVTPTAKQIWCVTGVILNMLSHAMTLSFPTSLIPALLAPDSEIPTDIHVASWIASCIGFAGIPGFLVSSLLMDAYGRRLAHLAFMVPGITGWLLIYFAYNVPILIVGRFLCGFVASATGSLGSVMIGEYSSPKNRGMFLTFKITAVCLGSMILHMLCYFYTWRTLALIAILPHIAALINILTWPESPEWLASKKRFNESEKAFYWLRGHDADSKNELEELFKAQKEKCNHSLPKSLFMILSEFFQKFTRRDFIKPVIIIAVGGLLLEASGRHIFQAYALQILQEITGDKTQSFYYTLGIDLIITISLLFSSILVRLYNRRSVLFGSGFAALLILICVCLCLHLDANDLIAKDKSWITIVLFGLYFIIVNLGCTAIPLTLMGEIFPLAHRGAGSTITGFMLSIYMIAGMKVTPYLLFSVKVYGTFAIFGLFMALCLIILYFILPETKDRTLQQIEEYFNFGKFKNKKTDRDEEVNVTQL